MLQKQVNMGRGHFDMNMVDDVRGVGVIKMMMVDDMGEGSVKNDRKSDDVICGRPLIDFPDGFQRSIIIWILGDVYKKLMFI